MKFYYILPMPLILLACERPAETGLMPIKGTMVTLSVNGEAKAIPDIAEITGGIEAKGANAKEALAIQTSKMNEINKNLVAIGIDSKDISTEQVNINPTYIWTPKEGQRIKSYQATNIVKVKVRKTDAVASVLDAMVKDGSNRIDGVVFKMENKDAPAQIARADALSKANSRAAAYAKAAGMKVFKIVAIAENGSQTENPGGGTSYEYYPESPKLVERKTSVSSYHAPLEYSNIPSVQGGEIAASVSLNVTYEFRK